MSSWTEPHLTALGGPQPPGIEKCAQVATRRGLVEFVLAARGEEVALTTFAVQSNLEVHGTLVCTMEKAKQVLAVSEQQIEYGLVEKIVCSEDGSLIGFYSLKPLRESDQSMELGHLFIGSRFVKQGFGCTLFRRAAKNASDRGAVMMPFISDPDAVGFYLKMGATKTGEDINLLNPAVNVSWMMYTLT